MKEKLLTKEQLIGESPVVIYNQKLNGEIFVESKKAIIIKVHHGDRQEVFARCKLDDGHICDRWVLAVDQD